MVINSDRIHSQKCIFLHPGFRFNLQGRATRYGARQLFKGEPLPDKGTGVPYGLIKMALEIMAWNPTLPSTNWVVFRSMATLQRL